MDIKKTSSKFIGNVNKGKFFDMMMMVKKNLVGQVFFFFLFLLLLFKVKWTGTEKPPYPSSSSSSEFVYKSKFHIENLFFICDCVCGFFVRRCLWFFFFPSFNSFEKKIYNEISSYYTWFIMFTISIGS